VYAYVGIWGLGYLGWRIVGWELGIRMVELDVGWELGTGMLNCMLIDCFFVRASHFCKKVGSWVRGSGSSVGFNSSSCLSRGQSSSHTSLGQMEAVKATLPVHFRHGMQWQNVSYTESPTRRYLMRPHRQAPVRSRGAGAGAVVLMMGVICVLLH
jgi:hypothetical protein